MIFTLDKGEKSMRSAMKFGGKNKMGIANAIAMVSQLGINMLVCVFVGVWAGNWLDGKLGTHGIFLIICILLGVTAGFMSVYKMVTKGMRKKK